jgi:hypothetical protein
MICLQFEERAAFPRRALIDGLQVSFPGFNLATIGQALVDAGQDGGFLPPNLRVLKLYVIDFKGK